LEEIKNGSGDGGDDDVSKWGVNQGAVVVRTRRGRRKIERIKMKSGLMRARMEMTPYREALVSRDKKKYVTGSKDAKKPRKESSKTKKRMP
jgi:hypothetical protein